MILGRLFEFLFKRGITLVATSNVAPDLLYKDGLQRDRFLPAIERLKRNCGVLNVDGGNDYRLRALHGMPLYLHPCDQAAMAALGERFNAVAPHGLCQRVDLPINGRPITARCVAEGAAWFDFHDLCDGPRSAADYIELASTHHTIVLSYRAASNQRRRQLRAPLHQPGGRVLRPRRQAADRRRSADGTALQRHQAQVRI